MTSCDKALTIKRICTIFSSGLDGTCRKGQREKEREEKRKKRKKRREVINVSKKKEFVEGSVIV